MSVQVMDTIYPADCLAYVDDLLAVGCYLYNGERIGLLLYFQNTELVEKIETLAILDLKYKTSLFGACSNGKILRHDEKVEYFTITNEDVICLSLDFVKDLIAVSLSNGNLVIYDLNKETSLTFKAHDAEAWMVSNFNGNLITGGDDFLLKIWDLRSQKTWFQYKHEAGVCSAQQHPTENNLFASGGYDDNIRIWDQRQLKKPIKTIKTSGGVWRIRWNGSCIGIAAMYGGCQVFDLNSEKQFTHEHNSIAYGFEWNNNKVASCSFYDHVVHYWNVDFK